MEKAKRGKRGAGEETLQQILGRKRRLPPIDVGPSGRKSVGLKDTDEKEKFLQETAEEKLGIIFDLTNPVI